MVIKKNGNYGQKISANVKELVLQLCRELLKVQTVFLKHPELLPYQSYICTKIVFW